MKAAKGETRAVNYRIINVFEYAPNYIIIFSRTNVIIVLY